MISVGNKIMIPKKTDDIINLSNYSINWLGASGNTMPSVEYPSNIQAGDLLIWIHGAKPYADGVSSSLNWGTWVMWNNVKNLSFGSQRKVVYGYESGTVGHRLSASVASPKFSSMWLFSNVLNPGTTLYYHSFQPTATYPNNYTISQPAVGKTLAVVFVMSVDSWVYSTGGNGWEQVYAYAHPHKLLFSLHTYYLEDAEIPPTFNGPSSYSYKLFGVFYLKCE